MAKRKKIRVLVTGATGFIGAGLVNGLLNAGYAVRALALPGESIDGLWSGPVEVFEGDITDANCVQSAVKGCSVVYHLVALVSDWEQKELVERITLGGTRHVMVAAGAQKARVVLASSIVVYADAINRDECDENHPHGTPLGIYSWSKQTQEREARVYAQEHGVDLVVIRPGNVIGPRCGPWVDAIVDQLKTGLPSLLGDGSQNAGLVCLDNLVDLFVRAGTKSAASGRIYNGCDGFNITWRQYFQDLATMVDAPKPKGIPRWVSTATATACEKLWQWTGRPGRPPITHEAINLVGSHHRIPNTRAQVELGYNPALESYQKTLNDIQSYLRKRDASG